MAFHQDRGQRRERAAGAGEAVGDFGEGGAREDRRERFAGAVGSAGQGERSDKCSQYEHLLGQETAARDPELPGFYIAGFGFGGSLWAAGRLHF